MASWLEYANQGATRSMPLSSDLVNALSFLPDLGLTARVFSGGQPMAGQGARVGSTRHDLGGAADVMFYRDGQPISWQNPDDLPTFQEIVRRGRSAGLTGFGAGEGYMTPGSMHIGFGAPAIWGAGGQSANAPDWLREAYGQAPLAATASTRGTGMNGMDQQRPGGLLEFMGIQRRDPSAGGETAMPFYQRPRFADFMGGLAVGLNELRQQPSQAIPQIVAAGQERRRDARQSNATASWLASQPNGAAYAQLIEAGSSPSDALVAYLEAAKAGTKAPRVETILTPEGGEVAVQWDENSNQWVPLNAPEGAIPRPPDRSEQKNKLVLFGSLQSTTQPFIDRVEAQYDPSNIQDAAARSIPLVGNFFQSEVGQQYEAASRAWAEGALRLQTGAAATADEIQRTRDTYFARPGDTPNTIALKRDLRRAFTDTILGLTGNTGISVSPVSSAGSASTTGGRSVNQIMADLEAQLGQ